MFNQANNWGEKQEGAARPAVAQVSGGRVGIFGARMYTTHEHTLTEDVGLSAKGRRVLTSVQSYHAQVPETLAAARWVCAFPGCRGKAWATKEEMYMVHGDPAALAHRREAHCVLAVSWLPADEDVVTGVMAPARGASAMTRITTRGPHGLSMGDQVTIKNVMGRHDAMASSHEATELLASVHAAETYERLGGPENKKRAQSILDSLNFTAAPDGGLVPLSVNGAFLAIPRTGNSFDIAQELDGVFISPADKAALQPLVVLRPRRPVLLSDVE